MYNICFVRDDQIVGYLGYEGMSDEVLRDKKEEALALHDLKTASKRARGLLDVQLPRRLKNAEPRELMMFHFCVSSLEYEDTERQIVARFPEKLQIKVISAATGGATETYTYEPK